MISSSENEDEDEDLDPSTISFGALAKAQASIKSRRQKPLETTTAHDDVPKPTPARKPTPKRSNKHAPAEMSSRRPVSRIDPDRIAAQPRPQARDPRFSSLTAGSSTSSKTPSSNAGRQRLEELKAERNYAFLDEYRDSEMAALRTALKRTKKADVAGREQISRALASMESRKAAKKRQREADEVVAAHRRAEKELVRQGKKPFYLKQSELKKRALVDRFAGMSERQVEKTIGKRRKKAAAKERRDVGPLVRRERGGNEGDVA